MSTILDDAAHRKPSPSQTVSDSLPVRLIEMALIGSRWLVVPLLFGLMTILVAFAYKMVQELIHVFSHLAATTEADLVIVALNLMDLVLVANLVTMVALSGYETTVSRLQGAGEMPSWLGKIDAAALKVKLAASVVAISSIHLLRAFLNSAEVSDRQMSWMVGIHALFTLAALAMAFVDRVAFAGHRDH
ncbi:TIGR00645 family protein [Azospirillum sp. B21]|uniref:TIGR00645 family protein n=1 Tax=Azospirillum sp. B21 TaxID=2607496 RepID=UPI0011EE4040|nr:TIGR00645 family protein [Azospirillum sp. B21]KAA0574395.1 TIGR00645 family protein [Azospirillum sp. B21]